MNLLYVHNAADEGIVSLYNISRHIHVKGQQTLQRPLVAVKSVDGLFHKYSPTSKCR